MLLRKNTLCCFCGFWSRTGRSFHRRLRPVMNGVLQILRAPSAAVRNQIEPIVAGVSAKKHFFTAVASSAGLRRALAPGENDFPGRCLDAAHGETYGTVPPVHRVHVARVEIDAPRVVIAGIVGRRRPAVALDADVRQGSRRPVAVARSRDCEAIAGMNAPPGRLGRCGADWDSKLARGQRTAESARPRWQGP